MDETRNYWIEETNQNELMSKKHKKVYRDLNYIEHLLISIFTVSGSVFISACASLVGIPIGIRSSAIELKICLITVELKSIRLWLRKRKRTW